MPFWFVRRRSCETMRKASAPLLLAACVALSLPAPAQSAVDGAIAGRVISAAGDAIVGAEVQVEGEQGVHRVATSGSHGEFLIVRLAPGDYHLQARAPGYRGAVELDIPVTLGQTTEVRLGHAIATQATGKHPPNSAQTPQRHTARSLLTPFSHHGPRRTASTSTKSVKLSPGFVQQASGTLIGADRLDALPVAGRDWTDLAVAVPGVRADPDADGANLLTVRGLPGTQNSSQIDGVSHDQSFGGVPVGTGATVGREDEDDALEGGQVLAGGASGEGFGHSRHAGAAYAFSQSAVREFRLSEGSYSALYGRAAGGILTAVSRSGTNTLHGAAFLTIRQSGLSAANPFSIATTYTSGVITSGVVKPHDLRQQFGGRVGGAIHHDRLFFFATYDQQRRGFPAIASPAYAGFYALTATQQALLGNRGVPRAKINDALNYLSSLTGPVARRHDQNILFGKIDWHPTTSNQVSVQYNRVRWVSPAGATTAAVVARGIASLGNNQGQVDQGVARWTVFLGPRFSNDLRLLYSHDLQYETAQSPLPQEPAIGPGGYAPEISIGPEGLLFGTPSSLGRRAYPDERRLQLADTFAWIKGRHLLRVGGEFSAVHDRIDALNNQEGTFRYDSGVTNGRAGGLVDWITDFTFNVNAYPNGACPSINARVHDFCFRSFSQSFGQQITTFDTQELAVFAQDDWRFRPGLTLNLGMRYEYQLLPPPQTPNPALDALFGKVGATSVFPTDSNNFGPRLGVAWQPFGRRGWVVHAGYGAFYGRLPGTTLRSALVDSALPASTTHVRITPGTETLCPQVANQGFGYACAYLTAPPAAVTATTSATVFDRRFRLPLVQQASFAIEHPITRSIMASISIVANLDRQLPNSADINIAPSKATGTFQLSGGQPSIGVQDGEKFVVPIYTSRLSTNYGPVTDIVSNANGTYNGLTLAAWKHGRGSLDWRVSWTWAKAIDYGQTGGGVPRTNGQFDPFAVGYDKGLSSLNYPHRVVASVVWRPKIDTDRTWLRRAANGWEAAPVFLEGSGRPYSYQIFGGPRLSGGRESINGSGGETYLPTIGRNTLRLPEQARVNLRLARSIHLGEHLRLQGVAEVFNLTNRVNYSGVSQRAFLVGTPVAGVTPLLFQDTATVAKEGLNTRPFGTFTAAGTSDARERQIQLGLRLEF